MLFLASLPILFSIPYKVDAHTIPTLFSLPPFTREGENFPYQPSSPFPTRASTIPTNPLLHSLQERGHLPYSTRKFFLPSLFSLPYKSYQASSHFLTREEPLPYQASSPFLTRATKPLLISLQERGLYPIKPLLPSLIREGSLHSLQERPPRAPAKSPLPTFGDKFLPTFW